MGDERISRAMGALAASVAADLPPPRPSILTRVFRKLRAPLTCKAGLQSAPFVLRDLDEAFRNPDAQKRIGAALAQGRRPREQ